MDAYISSILALSTGVTLAAYALAVVFGPSTTRLLNHSGSKTYEPYNYTYHKVNQAACSVCGRAAHSYTETHTITSYGSWSYYSSTQHVRSGVCTLCNDTGYQYATHSDSDGDHKCDVCGGNMPTVVVTLDANGGSCSPSQITVYFAGLWPSGSTSLTASGQLCRPLAGAVRRGSAVGR